MVCCSAKCQQWTTYLVSIVLLTLGILVAIFWDGLCTSMVNYELSVANRRTIGFTKWVETPIPMYLNFYLFNWTNSDKPLEKPHLVECGPYVFLEQHIREGIVFNENNNTITYKTKRVWHFDAEKTNGTLDDKITTVNVIAATVGLIVKDKHYLVRRAVNFLLEEKGVKLAVTKTADEFIFKGYEDEMIDLLHKINITGFNIPFDKFGWFYDRNCSADYDGVFNMYDGADDISKLGRIVEWNYNSTNQIWNDTCGKIDGTSGELWYPPKDAKTLAVFASDICGTVDLKYDSETELHGMKGYKYVADESNFDNGSIYPDKKCFNSPNFHLSGVRDVSKCKFGAPVFISYPHFYSADPAYGENVTGLKPDKAKHQFYISLEPNTGLPLNVVAALQVNIKIIRVDGITVLSNRNDVFLPVLWFTQTAELTSALASEGKLILVLPKVGTYTAYGVISIGSLLMLFAVVITCRKGWIGSSEEEQLLGQESL